MPSSYTSRIRLEKQAAGENSNSWGTHLNEQVIDMVDEAIAGITSFTLSTTKTLSTNNGLTDESRPAIINITSGTGGTVTIPNVTKIYKVRNATSGNVIFTTGSGTTATVGAGEIVDIISLGSNVVVRGTFYGSTTAAGTRTALGLARGFSGFTPGIPDNSELMARYIAPYAFSITQANCVCKAASAATASTTLTIKNAGVSIGTMVFGVSGSTATITINTPAIAAGDIVTIHNQANNDDTLADISWLIVE